MGFGFRAPTIRFPGISIFRPNFNSGFGGLGFRGGSCGLGFNSWLPGLIGSAVFGIGSLIAAGRSNNCCPDSYASGWGSSLGYPAYNQNPGAWFNRGFSPCQPVYRNMSPYSYGGFGNGFGYGGFGNNFGNGFGFGGYGNGLGYGNVFGMGFGLG